MLTFEKIIEPVIPLIKEERNRLKNDEKLYKLSLYYFMVSLIYAVINKTQSIRLLITEIKTNPDLKKLGFIVTFLVKTPAFRRQRLQSLALALTPSYH